MTSGLKGDAPSDRAPDDLGALTDDQSPVVGKTTTTLPPLLIGGVFALAALSLFLVLDGQRKARVAAAEDPVIVSAAADYTPPPLVPPAPVSVGADTGPFANLPVQVTPTQPLPTAAAALPLPPGLIPAVLPIDAPDSGARLKAPSLVVDLGGPPRAAERAVAAAAPGAAGGAASAAAADSQRPQLNDSEQFAKRVGEEEPDSARAVAMSNLRTVAPQGTIIPGVLETAINSDLPGFARAIVSRDVYGFDGREVVIPRSSRLIGQYKSAVALGQSRAFVIWTRLIRPDGVSIQIGSPVTDELGRGGLAGKVDRHFFGRFSGAILLSVLNAGVASIGSQPTTSINIGSPGAASGLAASALQGENIPPTIKVRQGEAINIFVARDLDFSGVGSVK